MNRLVQVENLGLVSYKDAWQYQQELFKAIVDLKIQNRHLADQGKAPLLTPNYLLFCEHPPVYTLGKSGKMEHLLLSEQELLEKGIEMYKINRGGDITYHGPGQLVGYPILDLDNFSPDIHAYMRHLEEIIILTLADYGLDAGRIEGLTGVWLDYKDNALNPRKICAMGVKSSRWVTMHGFALNVHNDLSFFENIVPCGIADKAVTSLAQEIGYNIALVEVLEKVSIYFEKVMGGTLQPVRTLSRVP